MFLYLFPLAWAASFEPKSPLPKFEDIPQINSWLHSYHMANAPDNLAMNRRNYFVGDNAIPHLRTTFMGSSVVGITDLESATYVLEHPEEFENQPAASPQVVRLWEELTSTRLLAMNGPTWHKYRVILNDFLTGIEAKFSQVTKRLCSQVLDS